jgi:hypothetical protein
MSNIVHIKEVSKISPLGLHEYGRSKFPGCFDGSQLKRKNGRWVTGIDELSTDVLTLPLEERESESLRIKEKRERFQNLTGIEDLSGTSKYWEDYLLVLDTSKPLNLENPLDELKYILINANRLALPSTDDLHNPDYVDAFYVLVKENGDVEDKVKKDRRFNKAIAQLEDLFENNPEKLRLVGKFLSLPITDKTPHDSVYAHLHTLIKTDGHERFLKAIDAPSEEIQAKLLLDKAIKLKVIRQVGGLYQRGNITIGNSFNKTVEFLKDPLNAAEVDSIENEIIDKSQR